MNISQHSQSVKKKGKKFFNTSRIDAVTERLFPQNPDYNSVFQSYLEHQKKIEILLKYVRRGFGPDTPCGYHERRIPGIDTYGWTMISNRETTFPDTQARTLSTAVHLLTKFDGRYFTCGCFPGFHRRLIRLVRGINVIVIDIDEDTTAERIKQAFTDASKRCPYNPRSLYKVAGSVRGLGITRYI